MSKVLELVVISILLASAFFFGVAYSDPVRENFSWLFEVKEQEVEIPNISEEDNIAKPVETTIVEQKDTKQEIDTSTPENFEELKKEN